MNKINTLTQLGVIKVSGQRARAFLQGQLTGDMQQVSDTHALFAAHCNPQGRVVSLFHVLQIADAFYLVLPRALIALTIKTLAKYAVFSATTFTDVSATFILSGCQRNDLPPPSNALAILALPTQESVENPYVICVYATDTTPDNQGIAAETWQRLTILAGIPSIYPETSGKFLAHELNLPAFGAIHFDKGCYTGQEIIARMHYRGKLKKQLLTISCNSLPSLQRGTSKQLVLTTKNRLAVDIVDYYLDPQHCDVLIIADSASLPLPTDHLLTLE